MGEVRSGWKRDYSLYPARAELVAAFEEKLAPYTVEKSTTRKVQGKRSASGPAEALAFSLQPHATLELLWLIPYCRLFR